MRLSKAGVRDALNPNEPEIAMQALTVDEIEWVSGGLTSVKTATGYVLIGLGDAGVVPMPPTSPFPDY